MGRLRGRPGLARGVGAVGIATVVQERVPRPGVDVDLGGLAGLRESGLERLDLRLRDAGVVSAAMNTSGQFGSLLCPLIVAYSVEWFKSWDLPLYLMGGLFLLGVVCWGLIDPTKPVFEAETRTA